MVTILQTAFSNAFLYDGPIENKSVLVQIMAWHQSVGKSLLEPMVF